LLQERGAPEIPALPHEKMKEDPGLTEEERAWLSIVRRQVRSLRYGVVQIVVHNARVVQIERTEKLRLNEALRLENEGSLRSMEGI
jgi:hypothetical protein